MVLPRIDRCLLNSGAEDEEVKVLAALAAFATLGTLGADAPPVGNKPGKTPSLQVLGTKKDVKSTWTCFEAKFP